MVSAQPLFESKNNGAVQSLVLFLLFFFYFKVEEKASGMYGFYMWCYAMADINEGLYYKISKV